MGSREDMRQAQCMGTVLLLISVFTVGEQRVRSSTVKATTSQGGDYTALQAILSIATADKLSAGIVMGVNPTLCQRTKHYDFSGMSSTQAINKSLEGTAYTLHISGQGVYNIYAPDPSRREEEVLRFRFAHFDAPATTMQDLGALLTGYITFVIEGAKGFAINTLGRPKDEILSAEDERDKTGPEIADVIVQKGARGIWILRPVHSDLGPKQGATVLQIYSYHDSLNQIADISCPNVE